jgi:hypothetical protein
VESSLKKVGYFGFQSSWLKREKIFIKNLSESEPKIYLIKKKNYRGVEGMISYEKIMLEQIFIF